MTQQITDIAIPSNLLPADGRFGSGPSRVRTELLDELAATGASYLGTSHRRQDVRRVVARIRQGLADLFRLPDGYEVLVGNGGATAFWDAAVFGLIERRSHHAVFGEFSSKFAAAVAAATHLEEPQITEAAVGTHPVLEPSDDEDVYALTHNETSTGVVAPVERVAGAGLTVVDATSAAGGVEVDPAQFDVYYFSPQKAFGGDGGLWVALCSPAAIERVSRLAGSGRYIPPFLSLATALDNSRKDQTYNTPALATLFFLARSVDWMLDQGGLAWSAGRCAANAAALYSWAERVDYAVPFVPDPAQRSPVTGTVDFVEDVPAADLSAVLRAHGIVDVDSYRKLGRNQLRIGLWPAVPTTDVEALTACIDYVVERL